MATNDPLSSIRISSLPPAARAAKLQAMGTSVTQPPSSGADRTVPGWQTGTQDFEKVRQRPGTLKPGYSGPSGYSTPTAVPTNPATRPLPKALSNISDGMRKTLSPLIQQYLLMKRILGHSAAKTQFDEQTKSVMDQFREQLKAYLQGVTDKDGDGIPDSQEGRGGQGGTLPSQLIAMKSRAALGRPLPRG